MNSLSTRFVNALVAQARRLTGGQIEGVSAVYFLRLRSGRLYVGCSTDLEQRLDDHLAGQACRTTLLDPPIALLRIEIQPDFSAARSREAQLKRWSGAKKDALICGDMATLHERSRSRD
ncbi:MAG TPA: GIY-YIG nuclease family protein [Lacipirellulaceae bacterium]|nr:GIY-YIG nuclease family protein [Lacipirellulaceae bacterium]